MKKVTVNGTVASHERYLYRGYLQLAALDMLDNRNVRRTLLWDPLEPVAARPLALVQGASLYCYGWDFNKNVTEVFDGQGTIAAAYDYSPYGIVGSTGNLVQPVQWSSEMNDGKLALVYYNYRYYNPADGGLTGILSLKKGDGICMGLLIMKWYSLLIISEKKLTNLATQ